MKTDLTTRNKGIRINHYYIDILIQRNVIQMQLQLYLT